MPSPCAFTPPGSILAKLIKPPYELLHNTHLDLLKYKTLSLVAATLGHHQASLHALTLQACFLHFDPSGVRLLPDLRFLAKIQALSFAPGEIWLLELSGAPSVLKEK